MHHFPPADFKMRANSVSRSRKFAATIFYLNEEGEMIYWGGEYEEELKMVKQRRGVVLNTAAGKNNAAEPAPSHRIELGPILEFKVVCGAALRSRYVSPI